MIAQSQTLDSYTSVDTSVQASTGRNATPPGGSPVPPTGAGTATLGAAPTDPFSGSATSSLGSSLAGPSAFATITMATGAVGLPAGAESHSVVNYAFELIGPPALTGSTSIVDVTALASIVTSGLGHFDGRADASMIIDDLTAANVRLMDEDANTTCNLVAPGTSTCTDVPDFSLTGQRLPVLVNHVIGVYLTASADILSSGGVGTSSGSFSASLDPVIVLDPGDPAGLELVFGSGISQPAVSSVPESPPYDLFAVGLAILAGATRKRSASRQSSLE